LGCKRVDIQFHRDYAQFGEKPDFGTNFKPPSAGDFQSVALV